MAERYDAAVIGAGADGLAAATLLAGAGLRTIVLERQAQAGGRLVTRQFHPGYFASPFADDVAPLPADLVWSLDLARHGARATPPSPAIALWPDRYVARDAGLLAEAARRRARALAESRRAVAPRPRWNPFAKPADDAWPREDWSHRALADLLPPDDADGAALLAAAALAGRAADPLAAGSALHLLAGDGGHVWRGGLGGLGAALAASARGADISCGLEVTGLHRRKGRVAALALADGSEIAARAVISTLDLKRTFLSLFAWSDLPRQTVKQVGGFRMAGSTARLLVALGTPPKAAVDVPSLRGAIQVMPDIAALVEAHAAWRGGVLAERLPLSVRFDACVDPGLAPVGAAVMTITAGCVPHTLFDGAWSHDKRDLLARRLFAGVEQVFPGLTASVVGFELLTPPDIEAALGVTAGDLMGGEIAPDQMFGFRPGFERRCPHTPVEGLYLAGPSAAAAPFGACVAGAVAANALIADLRAGRLP